jgi:hypothetical protein
MSDQYIVKVVTERRYVMLCAGVCTGLWGNTVVKIDANIKEIKDSWMI